MPTPLGGRPSPAVPPLLGLSRRCATSICGGRTERRRGERIAHCLPARLTGRPMWCTALGFMHGERAARILLASEPDNGRVGRVAVGHLDKPKTFAAAGVAVHDDLHGVHQAIGLKSWRRSSAVAVLARLAI